MIMGEFLWQLSLPYYNRMVRRYRDTIDTIISDITPSNSLKIRIRKYGDSHWMITIKIRHGIQNGYKVYTEKDVYISVTFADFLLSEMNQLITPIVKRRYIMCWPDGKPWDIDIYEEENTGLRMAEREADSTREKFKIPPWIGKEITNDKIWKPLLSTWWLQEKPISEWNQSMQKRLWAILW